MGRHWDGKTNYRVATGPLVLVLVAILVGALAIGWWEMRKTAGETQAGGECSKGDLSMYVAADPAVAPVVEDLANRYRDTDPVVRDFCVRPMVVEMGSRLSVDAIRTAERAASEGRADTVALPTVWAPATDDFVTEVEGAQAVRLESERARLNPVPVGVAVPAARAAELADASWPDIGGRNVATPGGMDAVASTLANVAMNPGAEPAELRDAAAPRLDAGGGRTAGELLVSMADGEEGLDGVAVTEPVAGRFGDRLAFVAPEGSPTLSAPLVSFASGGAIEENAARAAKDFVEWARDNGADAPEPETSPLDGTAMNLFAEAAARPTGPAASLAPEPGAPGAGIGGPDAGAVAAAPGSSLVLLDTSEGVDLPAVTGALLPLFDAASEGEGRRVALWNFSSPVTEGVFNPVRANAFFGPGDVDRSKETLGQLRNVGEPWLWRSILPAYQYAGEAYADGVVNRIVLITSGADASGDDPNPVIDQIRELAAGDRPIRVDVVVLGEDRTDGALQRLAEATGGAVHPADPADPAPALTAAFGL